MPFLAVAFGLAALAAPGNPSPGIFMAVLAEADSGFRTLAECEKALDGAHTVNSRPARGSAFNRLAGNISRCEIVDGEPLIVVVPRALAKQDH